MSKEISLYIHFPFCKNKCLYCDFLSFTCYHDKIQEYIQALLNEIKLFNTDKVIKSIFIGGGTPSAIPSVYIKELMNLIYDRFHIQDNAEITIEANPATFNIEDLYIYKECGINRISLGLQAWQNTLLNRLGRIHTIEQFKESYSNVRKAGFDNVNIDIMFALPGQSINDWSETVKEVIKLKPEHVSVYSLIIEEGTPFYEKWKNGELTECDEKTDRDMYYLSTKLLEENEYKQYEISNFSKKGKQCKHNIVYWKRGEYKGFGLGAASFIDGIRTSNTGEFKDYLNGTGIVESEIIDTKNAMSEFMFLGLRMTEGINISEFEKKFGEKIDNIFGDVLEKHIGNGFLEYKDEIIKLTSKGLDLSNMVFIDFI